jgi:hypothetical protein
MLPKKQIPRVRWSSFRAVDRMALLKLVENALVAFLAQATETRQR